MVEVDGTARPAWVRCSCRVSGPASRPSATNLSRVVTIAAITSSATARGLLAGRRERGLIASKPPL